MRRNLSVLAPSKCLMYHLIDGIGRHKAASSRDVEENSFEFWKDMGWLKKVSFGIFHIIKTNYNIDFFTVKTTDKVLSLNKF